MRCKYRYSCKNCEYADIWYSELDGKEVATCCLSEEERKNLEGNKDGKDDD